MLNTPPFNRSYKIASPILFPINLVTNLNLAMLAIAIRPLRRNMYMFCENKTFLSRRFLLA